MEGSSGDKGRDKTIVFAWKAMWEIAERNIVCSYQLYFRQCQMSDILLNDDIFLYVRYFNLNEDINSSKCVLYYQHGMNLRSICL